MGSISEAAARLASLADAAAQLPEPDRSAALRALLGSEVHDPVVRATGETDDAPEHGLVALARAVRDSIPSGAEDRLPPRVRTFVRLLLRDAVQPAWDLARENAEGVLDRAPAPATLSGGTQGSVQLPLTTVVEDGRIYAWLPGFRDPRWTVPDGVYDVGADVTLRCMLEEIRLDERRLLLAGWAHLSLVHARADDAVTVLLRGPDGAEHALAARRVRRPDLVKGTGEDVTRLARAGWCAEVDAGALPQGSWQLQLAVSRQGLRRSAPLGATRGPLAAPALLAGPQQIRGQVVRLDTAEDDALTVSVQRVRLGARAVPGPIRKAARRVAR